MNDIQKMLQMIINGQSAFRQEILKKLDNMYNRFDQMDKRFDQTDKRIDQSKQELVQRIDTLGTQLAYWKMTLPHAKNLMT